MTSDEEKPEDWVERITLAHDHQRVSIWQILGTVRVRLDEPGMEAIIRATSVYCASLLPPLTAKMQVCENLLVRLLRARMRLVRSDLLRRRFETLTNDERLRYRVNKRKEVWSQVYFMQVEMPYITGGLEILGRLREGGLDQVERKLMFRLTVLCQARRSGKRPHSELVSALNRLRNTEQGAEPRNRGQETGLVDSAGTRLRFREWTMRAAIFGIVSYMRVNTAPLFWKRAYRLLERMIRLHRDVIVSQVRHGKPGYLLAHDEVVRRGLGIDPTKQAFITPKFNVGEVSVLREGLEQRDRETLLNPTERVLFLKMRLIEGAMAGGLDRGKRGKQELAWRLAHLSTKKRQGPRASHW